MLDNVEQVAAADPDLAALLAACPGLTAVATSRVPLRLRAEHELPVPPLGLPPEAEDDPTALAANEAVPCSPRS